MQRNRLLRVFALALLLAAGASSCHLTFGGRGTQNRVIDRTLDGAVVHVSELSPRGD